MKVIRWVFAGVLFGSTLFVGSLQTASAELSGDCQASGDWQFSGLSVDASETGVVTIPRKDTVDWQGSVGGPPGAYAGSIWLELPPPFGKVEIDSWDGNSTNSENSGSKEYNIPKLVPAGVEIKVAGEHKDDNGLCSGSVRLQIKGGSFDSPVIWGALVLTALAGGPLALVVIAMVKAIVGAGLKGA